MNEKRNTILIILLLLFSMLNMLVVKEDNVVAEFPNEFDAVSGIYNGTVPPTVVLDSHSSTYYIYCSVEAGNYIVTGDYGNVKSWEIISGELTLIDTLSLNNSRIWDVYYDGTYIYAIEETYGLHVISINPGTGALAYEITYDNAVHHGFSPITMNYMTVSGNSTWIFIGTALNLLAYTPYDGVSMTLSGNYTSPTASYWDLWCNETIIYTAGANLSSWTFDGTNFNLVNHRKWFALGTQSITGESYVYVNSNSNMSVFRHTVTHGFVLLDSRSDGIYYFGSLYVNNSFIFTARLDASNYGAFSYYWNSTINHIQLLDEYKVGPSTGAIQYENNYFQDYLLRRGYISSVEICQKTDFFSVTRTIGADTESNIFTYQPHHDYEHYNITLRIPVSTRVSGIVDVTNNTYRDILATEVNTTDELENNTFYFDSANNYVYIKTKPLSTTGWSNWTVNCSYNLTFNINIPHYKEIGDDIIMSGTIRNSTGVLIDGVTVTTHIYNSNGTDAITPVHEWYLENGRYFCTLSTSDLVPGTYSISINVIDPSTGILHKYGNSIVLAIHSTQLPSGTHSSASLSFNFYNNNTGLGINRESFKVYVSTDTIIDSSDRLHSEVYTNSYTGTNVYYRIDDYFNNQVYPTTGSYKTLAITSTEQSEDIPIDWYSFSVKNMNHSIVLFNMTNGSIVYSQYLFPYEPFYWNVLAGTYTINLTYKNPVTDALIRYYEQTITINSAKYYWILGYDIHDVFVETDALKNRSVVIFNFYNTNEGLGLDKETLKVYVNGTRLTDNYYYCYNETDKINVTIKDYYNSTLYWGNFTINESYTFLDLGLTFHSWLFGNMNEDYYIISILKAGASRWWERGIVPGGEREFLIPSGTYAFRIYDKAYHELYNSSLPPSVHVANSKVYVIHGTNLSLVIAGQSIIQGQLLEVLDEITPSVIKVGYNFPFIRMTHGTESLLNELLGWNITLVCPPQILEGTTYNRTYTNRTIYPCIPGNTTENGTITVPDTDRLWFHGSTANWVNVSWTNGTVISNTTYVPTFINLYGHPAVWVNSSHNISITRETRYHQVQEFDYTKYLDQAKYVATVNFTNRLNKAVFEPEFFIAFADDGYLVDYSDVELYDVTNTEVLVTGDYDMSASGIQFGLPSLKAGETRQFRVTYYVDQDVIQPSEAIAVLDDYGQMKMHEGQNYNYLYAQWVNRLSQAFKGTIYIQFNFTMPHQISRESIDIWDATNLRYLKRDQFAFTESGIIISQSVVGTVQPQGARTYEIYYLYTATPTEANIVGNFLDSTVFPIPYAGNFVVAHLIMLILTALAITALLSGKTWRDHSAVFALCMFFVFLTFMAWING